MGGVTQAAIDLVKRWEGFRAKPYLCPAGVPTIGYGTVIKSLDHPPVTEAEATELLIAELERCISASLKMCPVLDTSPNKLAAVASFTYNLGAGRLKASTLRAKINEQSWEEAGVEFRKWVWAGGRKLPGLVARREDEARLFLETR